MNPFAQKHKDSAPQWHHVRLEARHLVEFELQRIKLLFSWNYMAAHRPRGMSLWMTSDNDGADIYLSPQSAPMANELIRRYQARPCDQPVNSTVLIAGDGYGRGKHESRTEMPGARNMAPTRRFLPAPYTYRCVRALAGKPIHMPWLCARDQMSPFVRRYAEAWALFNPSPRQG